MQYVTTYKSPVGDLAITADDTGLTGLFFKGENGFTGNAETADYKNSPALAQAVEWLNIYFGGKSPDFTPPLNMTGSPFQLQVWEILLKIPYGKTVTYGSIAKEIADKRGIARMSAQAVGGAVGSNKIGIIVPCHRVIGSDGSLTGYAGGLDKKIYLLKTEGILRADTAIYR